MNYKIELVVLRDFPLRIPPGLGHYPISSRKAPKTSVAFTQEDSKISKEGHGVDPHPGESDMAVLLQYCPPAPDTHSTIEKDWIGECRS